MVNSNLMRFRGLIIGVGFLLLGIYTLLEPPGLFGFAATECSPTGDCASNMAPVFYGLFSVLVGLVVSVFGFVKVYLD